MLRVYRIAPTKPRSRAASVARRAVILAIADYLECTLAERNRLLVATQYAPQQPYLSGVALTARLGAGDISAVW